jgi:outer membrane autotransporter protein
VDATEADALVASIGLDVSRHFQTISGGTWSLDGMIRYHHDFFAAQDDKHEITVRSPLVGSVTQIGKNRGADGLSIGLGATGHLNENTTFGVGYAHTWDTNGDVNTLAVNIVLTW